MDSKNLLLQLLSNKIKALIVLFLTTTLVALSGIFCVIMLKQILELVFQGGYENALPLRIALLLGSMFLSLVLLLLKGKQTTNLTSYIVTNLSLKAYTSLLEAESQEINREDIEQFSKKIIINSNKIGKYYFESNVLKFFERLIYLATIFITLLVISPILGLILYGSLPVFFLVCHAFEKYVFKSYEIEDKALKNIENLIEKTYGKIKNIKLLNGIKTEKEKFASLAEEYSRSKVKYELTKTINKNGLLYLSICLVMALVIGLGSFLYTDSSYGITVGTLVSYVIFVPVVYFIFKSIMGNHISFSIVDAEKAELDILLLLKSEVKSEPISTLDEIHNLKFVDVSYYLTKNNLILNNINFELKRGEKLGILSVDKISKKAIFDLLTKINKPTRGTVLINNCDINKINANYLRELITSIYDESTILDASIVKNIIYPNKFDDYKYNDALNRSGLKELLSDLPSKENTVIGPDKNNVPTDILQRVVFANAFYKDSKIYVLDDATEDYNPNIEAELLREVFKLKNKLVIILTDKVYNLTSCDKILIVEDGNAVEYGKYEDLLNDRNSQFYKLIKKSSLKKEKVS